MFIIKQTVLKNVKVDLLGNLLTSQYGIVNKWKLLVTEKPLVSYIVHVCNNEVTPNISKLYVLLESMRNTNLDINMLVITKLYLTVRSTPTVVLVACKYHAI